MGVQGWSRLLAEQGWIPDVRKLQQQQDEKSLWMNPEALSSHPLLSERLAEIPPGSELHVDGFCLCFRIHEIAYARHCQQVLNNNTRQKKWTPAQIRHIMPSFLPPGLLTQVTREFVETLRDECKLNLLVYWDGDERYAPPTSTTIVNNVHDDEFDDNDDSDDDSFATPLQSASEDDSIEEDKPPSAFKHETELVRQAQRAEEWSTLQDYCVHGKVPTGIPLPQWQKEFPKNRIFITQVMHALLQTGTPMQFCDEEADSIMARAVTKKSRAFIVGLDTDFCFFPDAWYIPINTLIPTPVHGASVLKAMIMRRDVLAESLDIPETAMVELAILMGNDYVSDTENLDLLAAKPSYDESDDSDDGDDQAMLPTMKKLLNRNASKRVKAFLSLLRHKGEGFQVTGRTTDIQECLAFVRRLYHLQDMSCYEIEKPVLGMEPALDAAAIGMTDYLSAGFKNATVDPTKGDTSLQDAVVRFLEMIVKHQESINGAPVLTKNHILAFQMLSSQRPPYSEIDTQIKDVGWRPWWRDVPVVYWIERIINSIVHNVIKEQHSGGRIKHDAIESPGDVFDPYFYHAYLRAGREAHGSLEGADYGGDGDAAGIPELASETAASKEVPKLVLPVDEFKDTILNSVKRNRVTIIQGDTGCGKSSRIPVMLLNEPPPDPMQQETKLFISQPRRIAAKALVERLRTVEPELKNQIALRMGHGVREYEGNQTRAWFVTTGYLVRLLANHPERFDDISVLIIDEVHERSVDTDILCLLCRRLLATNSRIRLVLMSATLAADMYRDYFGVPEPPIRVGARRFPVKEIYLEEIQREVRLSSRDAKKVSELHSECLNMKCMAPPSLQYMEKAYAVVANLATVIGEPGSSVLIFVPGMNDIVAITEIIEATTIAGIRFTTIPIHSDIPFEDQMLVFDASKNDEVKIVIATNAAESSLTLPEVDNVICLGLCKQIVYNNKTHRQMLTPTWISKASATQRAGRTGRVRPGTVYRIYARQNFENDMAAFEPGEMLRIPLDSVILMLKEMLTDEEQVSEVLLSCLEPPNIATIDRSFESLHKSHFITTPDDSCELTNLGSFVSSLGIDLALGSLIGLGIQMGVGAEAIQMAAILSFPKSPWVMSNPLVHPTKGFNENTCRSFVSRCHFDANLFSDPLAIMNLIWEYEREKDVHGWCRFHNIFPPRVRRLKSTSDNLRKRVADFVGMPDSALRVAIPPAQMLHGKVTMLRVLQVWTFHETMIEFDTKALKMLKKKYTPKGVSLEIQDRSDAIEKGHLEQILMEERHPYRLIGSSEIRQKGDFEFIEAGSSSAAGGDFVARLEAHLLSYASEKLFELVCISFQDSLSVYTVSQSAASLAVLDSLLAHREADTEVILTLESNEGKCGRGIAERACGRWAVQHQPATKSKSSGRIVSWLLFGFELNDQQPTKKKPTKKQAKKIDVAAKNELRSILNSLQERLGRAGDHKCLFLQLPSASEEISPDERYKFNLVSFGTTSPVNALDLRDILGPNESTTKHITGKQKIQFDHCDSKPRVFKNGKDEPEANGSSSWHRPLIKCAPEGARVVSVLVSSRRRENVIKLVPVGNVSKQVDANAGEDGDMDLSIFLDKSTNASFRWKRFNTTDAVFIDCTSVAATAAPIDDPVGLYCVCANTLEVRGGGLRAEGLTLLPPGRVFLLLARFTFGLFNEEDAEDGSIFEKALEWIGPRYGKVPLGALVDKIEQAVVFHHSAMDLGESLECFPDKVAELLDIFDGVDGYEATPFETSLNPFVRKNMVEYQKQAQREKTRRFYRRDSSGVDGLETGVDLGSYVKPRADPKQEHKHETNSANLLGNSNGSDPDICTISENFSSLSLSQPRTEARQETPPGDNISNDLATPIPESFSSVFLSQDESYAISSLFEEECDNTSIGPCRKLAQLVQAYRTRSNGGSHAMSLNSSDWQLFSTEVDESKVWYKAVFRPHDIGYTEPRKQSGAWTKKKNHWTARPRTVSDAILCTPPGKLDLKDGMALAPDSKHLVFSTIDLAIQMEAAFWLQRQFGLKKRPWYTRPDSELLGELKGMATKALQVQVPNNQKQATKKKKKTTKKKSKKNADRKFD